MKFKEACNCGKCLICQVILNNGLTDEEMREEVMSDIWAKEQEEIMRYLEK
jgi:ferredoxin